MSSGYGDRTRGGASPLTRHEITFALADYEETHAVAEHRLCGIHVWPLLRVAAGYALRARQSDASVRSRPSWRGGTGGAWSRHRELLETYQRWLTFRTQDGGHEGRPAPGLRDVVLLGNAVGRHSALQGRYYHTLLDPLVERLHARGLTTLVWELASRRGARLPRYRASALLSPQMDLIARDEWARQFLRPAWAEPEWFRDYREWRQWVGGGEFTYGQLELALRILLRRARIVERWLRLVQPRAVLLVDWVGPVSMAVTLAAHRLGIPTVDLQHGLQGPTNFNYSSWRRSPAGGYEVMPTQFWVWGERDADKILSSSPNVIGADRVIVAGYPWLNMWREEESPDRRLEAYLGTARRLRADARRTVLVTPPPAAELGDELLAAIKDSPRDWQWLIRVHPRQLAQRDRLLAPLERTHHPRVDLDLAGRLPLYALLRTTDVHLTWWSTCALEALAFGIRTVLIHQNGGETFVEFIQRGEMAFAPGRREMGHWLTTLQRDPDPLSRGTHLFAADGATEQALTSLTSRSHTGTDQPVDHGSD